MAYYLNAPLLSSLTNLGAWMRKSLGIARISGVLLLIISQLRGSPVLHELFKNRGHTFSLNKDTGTLSTFTPRPFKDIISTWMLPNRSHMFMDLAGPSFHISLNNILPENSFSSNMRS